LFHPYHTTSQTSHRLILAYLLCFLLSLFFHHPSPARHHSLSLHDALPICDPVSVSRRQTHRAGLRQAKLHRTESRQTGSRRTGSDRKSTRLNSSHVKISYAVFCLKKKTTTFYL